MNKESKLTDNLMKPAEQAGSKDKEKSLNENAGIKLPENELNKVAGGVVSFSPLAYFDA